jgi:hypothetical protein
MYSTDNLNWLANPAVGATVTTDVIGNSLTPDTDYYIKVVAEHAGSAFCPSITIKVKTNPTTA